MSKKKRHHSNRPRQPGGHPRPAPRETQLMAPAITAPASSRNSQTDTAGAQLQVVVGLITTGALDTHLGALQVAISKRHRDRQREASNQAAAQLRIGDRVALTEYIQPKYLQGATGTVTGWAHQNAIVHLDHATGASVGGEIRCPPLGLRLLATDSWR